MNEDQERRVKYLLHQVDDENLPALVSGHPPNPAAGLGCGFIIFLVVVSLAVFVK